MDGISQLGDFGTITATMGVLMKFSGIKIGLDYKL
jgi:hypothetical protein